MTRIFIETGSKTTSEYVFIRTLLHHLGITGNFEIITSGGKDNLHNIVNTFIENTMQGGHNLIVFDADTETNGGGFVQRYKELTEKIVALGITTDLFLFPDNKSDGDFETLLLQIAHKDKHQRFFDCFSDYEKCLGEDYVTPNLKGKLHTYISSMLMSKTKRDRLGKGEWQFENPEYWNLASTVLEPLKSALKSSTR